MSTHSGLICIHYWAFWPSARPSLTPGRGWGLEGCWTVHCVLVGQRKRLRQHLKGMAWTGQGTGHGTRDRSRDRTRDRSWDTGHVKGQGTKGQKQKRILNGYLGLGPM